jgi:hypothetical protein
MSIYRKFERESLSDVHAKRLKTEAPKESGDAAAQRKRDPAGDPLPKTMTWVAKLPHDIRPMALLRSYPRIANLLAANWTEPASFRPYIDELFVDRRGDRQGFPPEVMEELFALRGYYEDMHPVTGKRWDIPNKRG